MHDGQRTTHDDGWWPIGIGHLGDLKNSHPGVLKNRNQRILLKRKKEIELI